MFTAVYDERDRGPLRAPDGPTRRSCSGCARPRERSARCCRCTPTRWRRWTSGLRPRHLELERLGARRHPRRPTPSTSATATTRSATRGTPARQTLSAPRRGPAAPRFGRVPALAPVGLDRGPARRPLRGELRDHAPSGRPLLRNRDATSCYPPVHTGRFAPADAGRGLRRALRAHAPQAHRPGGPGVHDAAAGR